MITRCIAKDMLPMNIIKKPGFKQMLEGFDPRYQPPSRKYISKVTIPSLYNSTQAAVTAALQEIDHFSSTTDLWSSINMQPYLSYVRMYMVHFVSNDWVLQTT